MEQITVLAAHYYDDDLLNRLRHLSPGVRFVRMGPNGDVPSDGRTATVLLRCFMSKTEFASALAQAPHLQWVHTCTAGFDQLLLPELIERGLSVTRSAASHHIPIAEWAIATMLAVAKLLPRAIDAQRERTWIEPTAWPKPVEMFGGTMGIIGAGAIGTEVAKRAKAFGMTVLGTKRNVSGTTEFFDELLPPDQLNDVLRRSDFVVVACPLTPETRNMIGSEQFARMKPHAVLCNVARGAIIDEEALAHAVSSRQIAGAALDAFVQEPLPDDSPLWALENVLITPHASARSQASVDRALHEFALNLARFARGETLLNKLNDSTLGY